MSPDQEWKSDRWPPEITEYHCDSCHCPRFWFEEEREETVAYECIDCGAVEEFSKKDSVFEYWREEKRDE